MKNIQNFPDFSGQFLQNYYFCADTLAFFEELVYNQSIICCRKAEQEK